MTTENSRTLAAVAAELRALADSLAELVLVDEQVSVCAPEPAPVTVPLTADRPRPRCPLCDAPLQLVEVWTEVADSEDDLDAGGVNLDPDAFRPPATGYIWRCPLRHVPEGWPRDDDQESL